MAETPAECARKCSGKQDNTDLENGSCLGHVSRLEDCGCEQRRRDEGEDGGAVLLERASAPSRPEDARAVNGGPA